MDQCAAIVETNCGIVSLIMNEYACYGKGHTIHSSGQIQWFKNSVDDRSVQVGGRQRICTIDGYAMPLVCSSGFIYLSLLCKPSDKDFERYPAVHLTESHEWLQDFVKGQNSFWSCTHMNCCLQIYYTSICIFYILFTSRQGE